VHHAAHPPHGASRPHTTTTRRRDGYERHRPEDGVLYQTIAAHWPAFNEEMEAHGGLPDFVRHQFERFLTCGILEHGCLHLQCRECGHSQLVAFSCKGRGVCNSCAGRRMVDAAVHLEANVLPEVNIRHWVCTLPWGIRALLGYDKQLCAATLAAFVKECFRSLKQRAKARLGLASVRHALTGAVAAIQRTDSSLRLNVHFHVLVLDGVYVRDATTRELEFHSLPAPTTAEVADVALRTAQRLDKLLRAQGRSLSPDECNDPEPPKLQLDHPALAACYDAASRGLAVSGDREGQPSLRLVQGAVTTPAASLQDMPAAEVFGVNLYAKQVVDGRDRRQLERLCRYLLRPPIAEERLSLRSDGTLLLEFKKSWRDGTRAVVLTPRDLLVRLCAAIPLPYVNQVRYFGVLASAAAVRDEVVPFSEPPAGALKPPPAAGDQLELLGEMSDAAPLSQRRRWAWVLAHTFAVDLDHCQACGGPMRWVTVAKTPRAAARLMSQLGYARAPPSPPVFAPLGQLTFGFR
jgi:hypothetical protein